MRLHEVTSSGSNNNHNTPNNSNSIIKYHWAQITTTNIVIIMKYETLWEGHGYGQLVIGSFITTRLLTHHVSCRGFWRNIKSPRWLSPPTSTDLVPYNLCLFPKLKSPLKGKRFQTIDEIQENIMGQLMVIGRTVWSPKVPNLKETEVSLSYVQCLLYLVSSSVNVSVFHITGLDTFWTDLIRA